MKKWILCLILLLALPALATITNVQSNAKWTCSGSGASITCTVALATTTNGNLLAVWTFWQSTFPYTASVLDSNSLNTFPSAVGPTLQSASNASAQIFYAKSIHPSSGSAHDSDVRMSLHQPLLRESDHFLRRSRGGRIQRLGHNVPAGQRIRWLQHERQPDEPAGQRNSGSGERKLARIWWRHERQRGRWSDCQQSVCRG